MIVVMTKVPVVGKVKTRLGEEIGMEAACRVHQAMVTATLDVVRSTGLDAVVTYAGSGTHPWVAQLRREWQAEPQARGDLGYKLRHALRGPGRRVAIGTDCPHIRPEWLIEADAAAGVVLAPAEDGGYALVGVDAPCKALFRDIPWSTPGVLTATRTRAADLGLPLTELPCTWDVDTRADLDRLLADQACPDVVRAAVDG